MFAAVDCMAAYRNTLGVALAKLMLVNRQTPLSETGPLMRAAARDVKRYMALAAETRSQRVLPLGFCTEKDGGQTIDECNYFAEGSPEEAVDFFAVSVLASPIAQLRTGSDQAIASSTSTAGSGSPPWRARDTTRW